jgi:multidrug efflux pump
VGFGGVGNEGFTIVGLVDWDARQRTQQEMVAEVFPKLLAIPGVRAFAVNLPGLGQSAFQPPVQFFIGANNYTSIREWRDRILARARENASLLNVTSNYEETQPQLLIAIDRRRAADLEISLEQIGRTLQTMLASREVGTYIDRGRKYDVIVQAQPDDRISPYDLENILVRTGSGELIPLSSLIVSDERGSPPRLNRVNRLPSVTITASLAPGYDLGSALDYFERIAAEELPPEATITYLGQSLDFRETSGAIYITFVLALLIVFLVLAAQFESFVHPFIIMLAVPLAITGARAALLLTGISLNIYSQIGMVLLIGLIAKNGILIVEFANQLRDEGYSIREAIVRGSELRFRVHSAFQGQTDLALGNVVGSNIFNVLFILGLSALIVPLVVSQQLVRLDVPIMLGVSLLLFLLALDGTISRMDGLGLVTGVLAYTGFIILQSRRESREV